MGKYEADLIIECTISGIPGKAALVSYYQGFPGTYWEPPEPEEAEFVILDRKGYLAEWLENKMSEDEARKIEKQFIETIADNKADAEISRYEDYLESLKE
jgi:hypothetical protein